MNDHQLDLALQAMGRDRTAVAETPELRERVTAIPLTTHRRLRWLPATDTRGFTMFSAVKFVAAAAIVALFGGFLLTGILTTQQGDETAPAALTESPSPMTTDELLSGMVTEEVEPGVHRILNDGYRELSISVVGPGYDVDVTPDGSVWLWGGWPGLFRLGDESTFDDPAELDVSIQVAPDGSLWAIGQFLDDYMGIFSFDGQGWTEQATTVELLEELAIGPDGTVWVTGVDGPGTFLMRLEDDGSLATIEDWADVYDGDALPYPLAVSPDGDVWLIGEGRSGGPETEALLRFGGSEWEVLPLPEGFLNHPLDSALGVGPDGTVWVHAGGFAAGHSDARDLARFDDPGWTLFTVSGEPSIRTVVPGRGLLTVAADGSFWVRGRQTGNGCGGVAHFDGMTWTSYLVEVCILDLAIAPDGSVWLYGEVGSRGHLYVITPEAVAATE